MVGEVGGKASAKKRADERIHVVQHNFGGLGARFDHLGRSGVVQERLPGREDPLSDRVFQPGAGARRYSNGALIKRVPTRPPTKFSAGLIWTRGVTPVWGADCLQGQVVYASGACEQCPDGEIRSKHHSVKEDRRCDNWG